MCVNIIIRSKRA